MTSTEARLVVISPPNSPTDFVSPVSTRSRPRRRPDRETLTASSSERRRTRSDRHLRPLFDGLDATYSDGCKASVDARRGGDAHRHRTPGRRAETEPAGTPNGSNKRSAITSRSERTPHDRSNRSPTRKRSPPGSATGGRPVVVATGLTGPGCTTSFASGGAASSERSSGSAATQP